MNKFYKNYEPFIPFKSSYITRLCLLACVMNKPNINKAKVISLLALREADANFKEEYNQQITPEAKFCRALEELNIEKLSKAEKEFMIQMKKLENLPRTGWVVRNVESPETVAEHVHGTLLLAYSLYKQEKLKVNIGKVLCMLAIHEIGETIIGDITPMQGKKEGEEEKAALDICNKLTTGSTIFSFWKEFEDKASAEARFCYTIDKLEAVFMARYYNVVGKTTKSVVEEFSVNYLNRDVEKKYVVNFIERKKN